jgi:hypothetical protein
MSGGVVAARFRSPVFVPFSLHKRRTSRLRFARFPRVWHSISETTPPLVNPEKTAVHNCVAAVRDVTAKPAAACARQSRATAVAQVGGKPGVSSMCLFLPSPSVRGRRDRRHLEPALQPHPCTGKQTCARCRRRTRFPPECKDQRCWHDAAQCVVPRQCARNELAEFSVQDIRGRICPARHLLAGDRDCRNNIADNRNI